jgi:trehalose/maltose transport system permease protein
MSITHWSLGWKIAFYVTLILIFLIAVFPFYYAVVSSFKTPSELFEVSYWPTFNFDNYVNVFA